MDHTIKLASGKNEADLKYKNESHTKVEKDYCQDSPTQQPEFNHSFPRRQRIVDAMHVALPETTSRMCELQNKLLCPLMELYDKHYFHSTLLKRLKETGHSLKVSFDEDYALINATIKAAGMMLTRGTRHHEIILNRYVLNNTFSECANANHAVIVGGIFAFSRLEALCLTLEHELVHVLLELRGILEEDHHGPHFLDYAYRIFGHVSPVHGLNTCWDCLDDQTARKFARTLKLGDALSFYDRTSDVKSSRYLRGVLAELYKDGDSVQVFLFPKKPDIHSFPTPRKVSVFVRDIYNVDEA